MTSVKIFLLLLLIIFGISLIDRGTPRAETLSPVTEGSYR